MCLSMNQPERAGRRVLDSRGFRPEPEALVTGPASHDWAGELGSVSGRDCISFYLPSCVAEEAPLQAFSFGLAFAWEERIDPER